MTNRIISAWILFFILEAIYGVPICEFNNTEVTCTPGNDVDYILERGLVSDNNITTSISLKACRISEVKVKSFQNLVNLKSLDLSQNKITTLNSIVFEMTPQLTKLNISYNLITELPLGLFQHNPNLSILDLKGNRLPNPDMETFSALKNLRYLDLSYNSLEGRVLYPPIFEQNRRITVLDFSGNDMNDTVGNLLHDLQMLEKLYLNQCLLNTVPMFALKRNLNTVKQLVISKNSISKLDQIHFHYLESLERLDLAENIIDDIYKNVFKPLRNLKVIILRKNKLTYLPESLFQNMLNLTNIDLSFNYISVVSVNTFRGTGIKNLNLSNNKFSYLQDNFCLELRNSGSQLSKFFFNQNPWQCSCLLDILNEVKKFNIDYNSAHYDGGRPVCVTVREHHCERHETFNDVYVAMYENLLYHKE